MKKPEAITVKIEFPTKLQDLFKPSRYKILHGGRGGAKSWGIARALLLLGAKSPQRMVCCREIQDSIDQSVYKLLCDQIPKLGLENFYEVQKNVIRGPEIRDAEGKLLGRTEFTFHGLKHNVDNIKSLEGADIVWVEEAQTVGAESWDKLVPTVRKDGSEIWISFNPELETDETYQRFVLSPPTDSVVIKINHSDNPWFPKVLQQEMEDLKSRDYDSYLTIYEGHCRQTLEGAVYAEEIRQATEENRITHVPWDKSKGVHVFADLGWNDCTTLWFTQKVAMQYRVLLSYQNSRQPWSHYLQIIQDTRYLVDRIWLPHDGAAKQLGTGKSIQELTREAGKKCTIVPSLSIIDGINAARTMFPLCYFDEKGCEDGLQWLRRYVWEKTPQGNATRSPRHDDASHYADAFRYFAVGFSEPMPPDEKAAKITKGLRKEITLELPITSSGWMR